MVKSPVKPITLEEFLQLPETKPSLEYINGEIIQKPMPQGKHSILQGELVSNINALTKPNEVLPVPDLVSNLQLTVGQLFGWLKL